MKPATKTPLEPQFIAHQRTRATTKANSQNTAKAGHSPASISPPTSTRAKKCNRVNRCSHASKKTLDDASKTMYSIRPKYTPEKKSIHTAPSRAKVPTSPICGAGAENTVSDSEVYTATLSAVSLRPKFKVLDVKVLPIRKDGSMAESMFSPPSRPFCASEKRPEWFFKSHSGAETMSTTTPTLGTLETILRAILCEVTPGQRPYSSDSYLPAHLIEAAQAALTSNDQAARQHAHNALSTACWHIARGEAPQALARMRRAQSHITTSMQGRA